MKYKMFIENTNNDRSSETHKNNTVSNMQHVKKSELKNTACIKTQNDKKRPHWFLYKKYTKI